MTKWVPLEGIFEVLSKARKGEWTWTNNPDCKYIDLRIDMRDGCAVISDRDGKQITLPKLAQQAFPSGGMSWDKARNFHKGN